MTEPDPAQDLDERLGTPKGEDSPTDFSFDCEFCTETFQTEAAEAIKDRGVAHLEADHHDDLLTVFAERSGGDDCRNGCGYVFPVEVGAVAGFDCPECGHDHFPSFARRYLYWQIEESV